MLTFVLVMSIVLLGHKVTPVRAWVDQDYQYPDVCISQTYISPYAVSITKQVYVCITDFSKDFWRFEWPVLFNQSLSF